MINFEKVPSRYFRRSVGRRLLYGSWYTTTEVLRYCGTVVLLYAAINVVQHPPAVEKPVRGVC